MGARETGSGLRWVPVRFTAWWRWWVWLAMVACGFAWVLSGGRGGGVSRVEAAGQPVRAGNPDQRCAGCHGAIYQSWQRTTMARGSGWAEDGLLTGTYRQPSSGVTYQIDAKHGEPEMRYERESPRGTDALRGRERLEYFIGSGKKGRTYLFSRPVEGGSLWFEAPVNWYEGKNGYDMAPAYEHAERAPLALPVEPNCLHCHATGVGAPLPFAQNAWAGAPFAQGGVGCAACHGDAEAHLASGGKKPMLQLAKLEPERKESICLQCHLEGDAMVLRSGRSLRGFVPGEALSETAVYFVNASSPRTALRAASQYEALLRSACRRSVGATLTCTTCHDPHGSPSAEERVAYFRGRCLQCHTGPAFNAAAHHPEQKDCATCHMPTRATTDISHEQLTDHDIEARPRVSGAAANGEAAAAARFTNAVDLVAVGGVEAGDRERGLAYAQFAERGDRRSLVRAESLLEKVAYLGKADAKVYEELGYLAQVTGDRTRAATEYRKELELNPHDATALTNLAVLEMQSGRTAEAEALLRRVADRDPSQTAAVLDLAALECAEGKASGAKELVETALRYNPDDAAARMFLQTGEYAGMHCRMR